MNNKKKRSIPNKKRKDKKETRVLFYQKQFVVQMIYTSYYKNSSIYLLFHYRDNLYESTRCFSHALKQNDTE